jgi:hypothetical protein
MMACLWMLFDEVKQVRIKYYFVGSTRFYNAKNSSRQTTTENMWVVERKIKTPR